MIPVETSPISRLTHHDATSMMFIGSRSWSGGDRPGRRRLLRGDLVGPAPSGGGLRPRRASGPSRRRTQLAATTSSASSAYAVSHWPRLVHLLHPWRSPSLPRCRAAIRAVGDQSSRPHRAVWPPCRRSSRWLRACPVCSTNEQAARTFGPIDPSANSAADSCAGEARRIACWSAVPQSAVDGVHVGDDEQGVGVEVEGKQGAGVVLVDDRLDSDELAARRDGGVGVHDGDAAAAGAGDDACRARGATGSARCRRCSSAQARGPPGACGRRPA